METYSFYYFANKHLTVLGLGPISFNKRTSCMGFPFPIVHAEWSFVCCCEENDCFKLNNNNNISEVQIL